MDIYIYMIYRAAKGGSRKSRRDQALITSRGQRLSFMKKKICPFKPKVSKNDVKGGENQARDMSYGVEKKFFIHALCK